MKLFFSTLGLILLLASAQNTFAQNEIRSPEDLVQLIESGNYDVKLMQENTRKAEASLNLLKGQFNYPKIESEVLYVDDHRQPFSPFQSASEKNLFWNLYLESKTTSGITVSGGNSLFRTHFGQAEPANDLLPYPATFYQPELFVQLSLNLTQDLLGYITKKQIQISETNVESSRRQENLLKHKLTVTVLEMYYQLPILDQIQKLSAAVIGDFSKLEKSVSGKVDKYLAEKSDLLNIEALIFQQQSLVLEAEKSIIEIKKAMRILLGDNSLIIETPKIGSTVVQKLQACEDTILKTEFDSSLSEEFDVLKAEEENADLQAKIYHRQLLPEVKLHGRLATSGTDNELGPSLNELLKWDRPVYEVGVKFAWLPSPGYFKASKQASEAVRNTAALQNEKRLLEQSNLWKKTQDNIQLLRKKQNAALSAVQKSKEQIQDLQEQYYRGRLSIFELSQQRINSLRMSISAESIKAERLSNILEPLEFFNRFQCDFLPSSTANSSDSVSKTVESKSTK